MTQTATYEKPIGSSNIYDVENSMFILWICYQNEHKVNYYLRYKQDKDYSGNMTEWNRAMKIIAERLLPNWLEIKSTNQRIFRAKLYRNDNRGNRSRGNNSVVWELDFDRDGFIQNQPRFGPMKNHAEKASWEGILKQLIDYSKTNRAIYNEQYKV